MTRLIKNTLFIIGSLSLLMSIPAFAYSSKKKTSIAEHTGTLPDGPKITKSDIKKAQKMWGDAVVSIGKAKNPKKVAQQAAKTAYAFELGPIMFKPTLTNGDTTFRPDMEGTLSYFVSGNAKYVQDKGFALKPWTKVRFANHNIKMFGNKAIAMGHYFFTDKATGKETKVEYTKGYVKTKDGRILLFLQDSSLPYTPQDTKVSSN